MFDTVNPVLIAQLYSLLQGSDHATVTSIVAHSGGERCSRCTCTHTHPHTHIDTETSAGHHHHSGNNTRDGYHKGKLWAPGRLGKMIWLALNNELWESACPALIFLPWHPLQGCQSDGRIKRPTTFFFLSLSLPPGVFLFLLSGGLPLISGDELKVELPVDRTS